MWLFIYQSIHPSSFPLRQPWVKTHLPITPSFRSNIRHSNTYHTGPVGEGEMNDWLWFALSWNPVLRGFIGHFTLKWSWISILLSHGYQIVSILSESCERKPCWMLKILCIFSLLLLVLSLFYLLYLCTAHHDQRLKYPRQKLHSWVTTFAKWGGNQPYIALQDCNRLMKKLYVAFKILLAFCVCVCACVPHVCIF